MADESDYTDVTEEEAPARPATKSPFEAAPEVKPEKKKSKSRSRHRRRRHKHRSHRSKSRGEDRRGRAVRRTKDRSSHGDRRGDSKVPEPLMPPKLSRAEQEEKKARKGQKGPNKGGKGGGKAQKSWVCKECGQKTAPHAAAMEQHQYLNERCLSHQFWYKMTKKAQEESGSWYRAQQMARSTKFQRQSEAQDAGWEVPEEEERSKSPLWTSPSWRRSPARGESVPSGSAGSWKDRRAPAEPEMVQLVPAQTHPKKKKTAAKESSDSEPEPEDASKKGKKRRPVVINIH